MAAITLCDGCGRNLSDVLDLRVELRAGNTVNAYDACPACMRKVKIMVAEIMSFTIENRPKFTIENRPK